MTSKLSTPNRNNNNKEASKWNPKNGVKNRNIASPIPPKERKNSSEKQTATKQNLNEVNSERSLKKTVTFSDPEELKNPTKRLLLVSNKCKYGALLEKAVKPNVVAVLYNYESNTLDSLLALVSASLGPDEKVASVGCIMTCKHAGIFMLNCHDNGAVLSSNSTLIKTTGIGLFFRLLFNNFVDKNQPGCRLDFFGAAVVNQLEKNFKTLQEITGATINVSKEQLGIGKGSSSIGDAQTLGDLYFTPDKIRNWSNGTYQTIDLFEKIRTVGKGAFGTAVLYRKKDDNSLVILKEINMSELNSQERQLAMNETKVLKMLNHPNIICCYDSFEENGVLMIEMEYADDGTLAQYLAKQESPLPETVILNMFSQIVSGIRHMHEQKVLHRDLKTANIFLTKEGLVKIGDFGVSKIMSSHNKGANTVLGTPYYISPEICEGKPYNEKSDIWALGCILHEMATRQKTFESTNLPALVNKIMRGHIAPIQGNFSPEFEQLVHDMLHREPVERPTAQVLDLIRLPDLLERFEGSEGSYNSGKLPGKAARDVSSASNRETRSVLYLYDTSAMAISPVEGFPSKIQIRQVAVGENHFIAVAIELNVYSWGQNNHGQLGHGSLEPCTKPQVVEALKGKSVTSACAGSDFSIFVSDNGILMTCGDGRYGCLGHGDLVSTQRPRLVESLLSVDVSVVACGLKHVVALGSEGEVFAWGDGKDGRLGIGNIEIKEEPTSVPVGEGVTIRDIRCGEDGTMFITEVGTLLACGNNRHNKLGLNERRGFLSVLSNKLKLEVEFKKSPTPVKAIKGVVDVAMGKDHTSVLTESGDVYMLGSNRHAQLGTGDNKIQSMPYLLKSLRGYEITAMICGDRHTAVGTSGGPILFWGTRFRGSSVSDDAPLISMNDPPSENDMTKDSVPSNQNINNLLVKSTHRRTLSSESTISYRSTLSLNQEGVIASEGSSRASSFQDVSAATSDKAINSRTTNEFDLNSDASTPTNTASSPLDLRMPEVVFSPQPILNIVGASDIPTETAASTPDSTTIKSDSNKHFADERASTSSEPPPTNYTVFLDCLMPCAENFYILVGTNAPVAIKPTEIPDQNGSSKNKLLQTYITCLNLSVPRRNPRNSASSNEAEDEYTSSEVSEMDSLGAAPTWIQEELKKSLESVTKDDSPAKTLAKVEKSPRRPTTLANDKTGNARRKTSPSPSRYKSTGVSKPVDSSSSDSSSRSVVKQSVNRLSVESAPRKTSPKGSRRSRSISPLTQRPGQPSYTRNRMGRGRGRLGYWESPKPSKSPVRNNLNDLREKVSSLQVEKTDAEEKLKEVKERNENMLRELQVRHEKEKLEQERWLHDQLSMLKKQLDEQQRELNEREMGRNGSKTSKQYSQKSESFKNSKVCTLQ